ncbi:MAG TPA: hypothetical protein VJ738_01650 [Steroidobacteraceae bacterium]|nr:hypothetical protein [Steroidobacteraceae bacterium]
MVDYKHRSRKMLLEAGGFETNLARRKIHRDPPTYSFVVSALLNSMLDTVNGKGPHRSGASRPIDINAKGCYPEEPKSRRCDAVPERPTLWQPFQNMVDIELQFTGSIFSFC